MREGETYGSWVWAAQSSIGLKYLYASRPWSPVAEAYHNRARWYSPEAGRFLTRDPIGYLGGVNQYMYANGNPIGFRDPWGLRADPEGGSVHSWTGAGWADWLRDQGVGELHPITATTYLGQLAVLGILETGQSAAYLTEGYDADGQLTGWGYAGYGAQTLGEAASWVGGAGAAARAGATAARTAAASAWARASAWWRGPQVAKNSSNILFNSTSQLQSKFKHAADFGVTGPANKSSLAQFCSALNQHINSPDIKTIQGTYHKNPVTHHVDPSTGLNVMTDPAGNFISG